MFLGLIETDKHLFCAPEGATVFLWGADRLGRDIFSRIFYGGQLSLTVGLIGITVSFILGITIGGISGYFGGVIDLVHPARDRGIALHPGTTALVGIIGGCSVGLEPRCRIFYYLGNPRIA